MVTYSPTASLWPWTQLGPKVLFFFFRTFDCAAHCVGHRLPRGPNSLGHLHLAVLLGRTSGGLAVEGALAERLGLLDVLLHHDFGGRLCALPGAHQQSGSGGRVCGHLQHRHHGDMEKIWDIRVSKWDYKVFSNLPKICLYSNLLTFDGSWAKIYQSRGMGKWAHRFPSYSDVKETWSQTNCTNFFHPWQKPGLY